MLSTDIRRDGQGVDRCNRTIMTAVPNISGDPSKGYHNVQGLCNKPITQRISDGVRACPNCDREPPVGNVHPKTINASQVSLSEKELKECGLNEDYTKVEQPVTTQAMEAPVEKDKSRFSLKDAVGIEIELSVLEQCEDIPALLIKAAIESMDNLPVTNFKESKRLIKLQEKMEALLRV